MTRLTIAVAAAALLTGCPETLPQNCPSAPSPVGGFTLNCTSLDDAGDFCRVVATADGGATDGAVNSRPGPFAATLCSSPSDGGTIYLVIAGQTVRQSPLSDAGGFAF